ncbi:MAG: AAA family ATPase [Burkholderiales bacterium]
MNENRESPSSSLPACAACGFANPRESRFCATCGASLGSLASRLASGAAAAERPQPERRQLTVLFCDLVGSTSLSTRLDPEELRDLILAYQTACTAVIRRYEGTVSRYMGDGILALFGYPRAHEDDAERAVLSALDILAVMATLPVPGGAGGAEPLAARIGIATGVVVVGDLVGEGAAQEEAVVGETPNLAARLQALATPNTVVIAAGTRALIGERFDCADLGAHALKGFAERVPAWQVLAPRFAGNRFEAAQRVGVSPRVNREEQMRWLLQLWATAAQGHGRVALLAGEAGIGKSRMVQALREALAAAPHLVLACQCSPHFVNTALHPVIEYLQRAADIGPEDSPAHKLAKLSAWLGPQARDAVSLLGALLSIPADARPALPPMSPQRQKELTFDLLLEFMQRLAAERPLLVVFEDVHWIDPTTQEFLGLLIERARKLRALVVLTCRPESLPAWNDRPRIEQRALRNLAPEYALELTRQVAAERLPPSVIEQVVARTDGVPLFVEELTRAVLGSAPAGGERDGDGPDAPPSALSIPATLQDSLMARLDQLGPAKLIAQVAGAIGREFNAELLEAVAPLPAERVREGLRDLQYAGLVYAEPGAAGSGYAFKHALVQEVAYESLLRSRRRELHLRIAEVLESRFPQTARDTPELVAHHWTEAGVTGQAIASWLAAGLRASERSEYREAIGHLRRGLTLIPQLADEQVRRERELALLLALGPALITVEGGGTPEVGTLYARTLELCAGTPASEHHFAAHWGWWRASMDHRSGRERADQLLGLARKLSAPSLLMQAHHCQWATLYMLGAHGECRRHIEAGLALYDPDRHRTNAALYGGHDARVCALGEHGLASWMLGHPGEALGHAQAALAWAQELNHVGSRAHAMDYALVLQKFRRNVDAVHQAAGELLAYATEQKLRVHQAKGTFFRGWARALHEDAAGGLKEMLEGIASVREVDTPTDFALYYEMLAEVYARAGRLDEGLRAVDDAFAVAGRYGIVFWNAELHRRRGELLLAAGESSADACFEEALACARAQQARSLEVRAAVSLARLRLKAGDRATVDTVLRPLYDTFSEGHDTPDLLEARQLIEAQR